MVGVPGFTQRSAELVCERPPAAVVDKTDTVCDVGSVGGTSIRTVVPIQSPVYRSAVVRAVSSACSGTYRCL